MGQRRCLVCIEHLKSDCVLLQFLQLLGKWSGRCRHAMRPSCLRLHSEPRTCSKALSSRSHYEKKTRATIRVNARETPQTLASLVHPPDIFHRSVINTRQMDSMRAPEILGGYGPHFSTFIKMTLRPLLRLSRLYLLVEDFKCIL